MNQSTLPEAVSGYIAATNAFDLEALMATFGEDAVVNDHCNEFAGRAAIRKWAEREIVADRVTMKVTGATQRSTSACVTAIIDGKFDKTGLPDPLVLTFYFSLGRDRIDQLVIVHNKPTT
jgi:ketosteroid isomerase-like protein